MAGRTGEAEQTSIGRRIHIRGTVQGVGFRPFVYGLALAQGIRGWVQNGPDGVVIEAEGELGSMEDFIRTLGDDPPPLARIAAMEVEEIPWRGFSAFVIDRSEAGAQAKTARIPPDAALCGHCRQEMEDPQDRHYRYPFTNCTHCGPRFTIVREVPYDRAKTSMTEFVLCPDCAREYGDPLDRRFHAQPVACPVCGPRVWLADGQGRELAGPWEENFRRLIGQGKILALKGLGGFHLVCDGRNEEAVGRLRQRKNRPSKAFAVMVRDLATARRLCLLNEREEQMLTGPTAPIVVLERREGADLPGNLAPGSRTLGVMVPYTPLHHLLFDETTDVLVMTSGNLSGLPLARSNEEALAQLGPIVDGFVLHNREIVSRADDSVVRWIDGGWQFYRRSRGYVPDGLSIPWPEGAEGRQILAAGSEMKNTFALLARGQAYLSQHIGNVETWEGRENYLESYRNLQVLLDITPQEGVRDSHPAYRITALAEELGLPLREAQHHHAHLAAVLADNGERGPAIGAILDGTGYGEDGGIRGFEILSGDYRDFRRHHWLRPVPLPGGDSAVRNPWLTAAAFLAEAFGSKGWDLAEEFFPERKKNLAQARQMVDRRFNCPLVSSAGRLFDAVSALLGICSVSSYEGQAPLELGERVEVRLGVTGGGSVEEALSAGEYPFGLAGEILDFAPLLEGLLVDRKQGTSVSRMASRFHNTIARMTTQGVLQVRRETGLNKAALGGGVMQNPYILTLTAYLLGQGGMEVLLPRRVPANDGGLALGQGMIDLWRWK